MSSRPGSPEPSAAPTAEGSETGSSSRRGTSLNGSKRRKDRPASQRSGCEVPFVPAEGGSSFTRFKQLSTRRCSPSSRPRVSPARPKQRTRTVSSPSLTGSPNTAPEPEIVEDMAPLVPMNWTANDDEKAPIVSDGSKPNPTPSMNPRVNGHGEKPSSSYYLPPTTGTQWTLVEKAEDHPCRRKSSGFFQPIKHLSGKNPFIGRKTAQVKVDTCARARAKKRARAQLRSSDGIKGLNDASNDGVNPALTYANDSYRSL